MLPKTKAHIGLFFTNFFFAVNLIAIKYFTSNGYAGPYGLNMIRIGVSVILFWAVYLFSKERTKLAKKDIGRFLLCALTALAINQMLFMKGLSYTFSIHVSLLLLITPILITFIAAWILNERLTPRKIIGLFAGVAGASILIHSGVNSGHGNNILLGDLLIILSAFSYTFYFILVKPLMFKYPPIDVMRWVFTFGFLMVIPLGYNEFTLITWQKLSFFDYFLMFLIVVPGTFLAYIFNVYGIKVLSASVAGTYIYLQPFFAVLFAMAILGEELTLNKIIAAILIFTGVYLANYKRKI